MVNKSHFIRKASLLVGDDTNGIDLSSLHYKFSIKMAELTHPQYATFRIYNISTNTLNEIQAHEYRHVLFQAGYQQGDYGPIFDGEVIQGIQGRESPVDTYLDILCAVGYSSYQAGVSTTLAAGSSPSDLAGVAAGAMGKSLADHSSGQEPKMPRGQVCYGPAHELMTRAASGADASWFFDSHGITMIDDNKTASAAPIVLNATTGLIAWPEQTQDGIRVRSLLNPSISVATVLKLDNNSILRAPISPDTKYVNTIPLTDKDGLYRVLYYEHSGDTRGNEWYTDIVGLALDPSAAGLTGLYQRGLF